MSEKSKGSRRLGVGKRYFFNFGIKMFFLVRFESHFNIADSVEQAYISIEVKKIYTASVI